MYSARYSVLCTVIYRDIVCCGLYLNKPTFFLVVTLGYMLDSDISPSPNYREHLLLMLEVEKNAVQIAQLDLHDSNIPLNLNRVEVDSYAGRLLLMLEAERRECRTVSKSHRRRVMCGRLLLYNFLISALNSLYFDTHDDET